MKPANATVQDDIPPTHVLEAAQKQDRKETEDLLAGFDRPGRGPKPVSKSKERDFVDYYARKKPGAADSGGGRAASPAFAPPLDANAKVQRQANVSTVIVHRKREGIPGWLAWAAIAVGMLVVGGAVAYLATADGAPSVAAPTAPSAATTITSAMSPPQGADTNIPPPAPIDPTATTATTVVTAVTEPAPTPASQTAPRGSAKRDARGGASASAGTNGAPSAAAAPSVPVAPRGTSVNATDGTKPPPRDDFIRDL